MNEESSIVLSLKRGEFQTWRFVEEGETSVYLLKKKNALQLIYNKEDKYIQWRKDFNKWYWKSWTDTCERMRLDHFLTPCTKISE